ncbi:YcxB family protein [Clostridium tetani]|uniref:YcxB family protein n=1 Tax=Clostridium tetani TaxID=1513 RepID=UPI0013E92A3D|nr:YcxB family protein [Clostridium tetani]
MNLKFNITMDLYKNLLKEIKYNSSISFKDRMFIEFTGWGMLILYYVPLLIFIGIIIKIGLLKINDASAFPGILGGVLFIIGFWMNNTFMGTFHRKKTTIKKLENIGYIGQHEVIINEQGIKDSTDKTSIFIPWDYINSLAESKSFILIQTNNRKIIPVPKRALEDNNDEKVKYIKSFIKENNKFYFGELLIEELMNERLLKL